MMIILNTVYNELVQQTLMMTDSLNTTIEGSKLDHSNNGRLRLLIITPFVGEDQIYEIDCEVVVVS